MTERFRRRLPMETLSRLPAYREYLLQLAAETVHVVSSRELAAKLGVSDAQLRRDLSYLGLLGRPGLGYQVRSLLEKITEALGLDRKWSLAIVGSGALGTALARYEGFALHNMEVTALFDVDPKKVGKKIGNAYVSHLDDAAEVVAARHIDIAIITVPAEGAQTAADAVVGAGVKAVLNFAPVAISVPKGVIVRNVDISSELQILTHFITTGGA